MTKPKLIKNPARRIPDKAQHYVPQYQIFGIEPQEHVSSPLPSTVLVAKGSKENPRLPRPTIRQPYAEPTPAPLGKDPLPNIGNNAEHTWSSLDGEVIDDLSDESMLDPETPMIDNNDFVSFNDPELSPAIETSEGNFVGLTEAMRSIQDNECIVFVKGEWFDAGWGNDMESVVQDLVFGEHPVYQGQAIPIEDILVVRKVPIKVGVFLE